MTGAQLGLGAHLNGVSSSEMPSMMQHRRRGTSSPSSYSPPYSVRAALLLERRMVQGNEAETSKKKKTIIKLEIKILFSPDEKAVFLIIIYVAGNIYRLFSLRFS